MIKAKYYSGTYGTVGNDDGNIIHLTIKSVKESTRQIARQEKKQKTQQNKEIIFLIDVSASMTGSMAAVKSSLLAFRDAILNKTHEEMEQMDSKEKDDLLRNTIDIRIITFSNTAKEVWSKESTEYFEDIIINLKAEMMTNMGDAMKLGFEKVNENKYSWIIIMTDGESNEGPNRTAKSFAKLAKTKPINSKIISLGYGDKFEPDVLENIGTFVYVENSEKIPVVFGNLVNEITTSVKFGCSVFMGVTKDNNSNIDIIDPNEISSKGKVIVGSNDIGPLCQDKEYNYIYLMGSDEICNNVTVKYMDMESGNHYEIDVSVVDTGKEPTSKIREMFFDAEKKRLMYRLYLVYQKGNKSDINKETEKVKNIIKCWEDDEISEPHQDEIHKLLEDMNRNTNNNRNTNTALNYAVGSGYSNTNNDRISLLTRTATEHYMASPLINN